MLRQSPTVLPISRLASTWKIQGEIYILLSVQQDFHPLVLLHLRVSSFLPILVQFSAPESIHHSRLPLPGGWRPKIPENPSQSGITSSRAAPNLQQPLCLLIRLLNVWNKGPNVVGSVQPRAAKLLWSWLSWPQWSARPGSHLQDAWFWAERSSDLRASQRPEVKSRWDKLRRRPSMAPFHGDTSDQSIKSAKRRLRKRKRQRGCVGKTPGAPHSRDVASRGSAICKAKHSQGKLHIKIHSSQNTSPPRVLSC